MEPLTADYFGLRSRERQLQAEQARLDHGLVAELPDSAINLDLTGHHLEEHLHNLDLADTGTILDLDDEPDWDRDVNPLTPPRNEAAIAYAYHDHHEHVLDGWEGTQAEDLDPAYLGHLIQLALDQATEPDPWHRPIEIPLEHKEASRVYQHVRARYHHQPSHNPNPWTGKAHGPKLTGTPRPWDDDPDIAPPSKTSHASIRHAIDCANDLTVRAHHGARRWTAHHDPNDPGYADAYELAYQDALYVLRHRYSPRDHSHLRYTIEHRTIAYA